MRKKWNKLHVTLRIGLIILTVGLSPLLIIIGLDELGVLEAGNAFGPGLLAMISFFPSVILIIIGAILTFLNWNKVEKTA
jgi:hypothetical protein